MKQADALLKEKQVIFWDFDGVIKDSVIVKSIGYEKLFMHFGEEVVEMVRHHHKVHGGISRYEKIPLYLSWAGQQATAEQVKEFCDRFSGLVIQAVIDAPWVPGIREYLQKNQTSQCYVLITATPQKEIEHILDALDIFCCFREVHGAPKAKADAIGEVLSRLSLSAEKGVVVGDSDTDLKAAEDNNVDFLLRRTPFNQDLQKRFQGSCFESLSI
jgi:phosphoglycolate phosphatase-like HAD superfamily hydrolase